MPRLMSVAFTEEAVVSRRKTVTRRKGWTFLKPGDRLTLCRKVMGRKKGEPLVRLAEVEVVSVTPRTALRDRGGRQRPRRRRAGSRGIHRHRRHHVHAPLLHVGTRHWLHGRDHPYRVALPR